MSELLTLPIAELNRLYRKKKVSPVEVLNHVLSQHEKVDSELNAFISILKENALQAAKKAETLFLQEQECHLLTGVPYSVKDLFYTKNVATTCGSSVLRQFVPDYTASIVQKLEETGAVLFGKNNMLEFAYGIVHPDFGQTNNPWDLSKTAGGSSGGSAAAVAAGIGYFSLGTDTGGSIRIPASYCGTVGLKPTYGFVNTHGVFPLSWSLDHAGPITRNVQDAAIVLQVITGDAPPTNLFEKEVGRIKVGILPESKLTSVQPEVKAVYERTLNLVASLGWEIEVIEINKWNQAEETIMNVLLPEAAHIHEKWLDKEELYAPMTSEQIKLGLSHKAIDYIKGIKAQSKFKEIVTEAIQHVDVVLMPTVAFPAPSEDPVIGDTELNEMTFTGPFNVSGHPAVTVNMGFTSNNLPVGMQLVGKHFGDMELLQITHVLEQHAGINYKSPILPR